MKPTDDLVAIGREPDAFHREHVEAVQRFVARRVESPEDAADLTADTRRSRPRLLMAAVTEAGAAAAFVVVPGIGSHPAYSVGEGNSGTITVEVHRLENAKGLEAELARYGVPADITYLSRSQQCAPGRHKPVVRRISGMGISMGADLLRVTLPPGAVRDGETFVMAVSGTAVPPSSSEPSEDGVIGEHSMHGGSYGAEVDVVALTESGGGLCAFIDGVVQLPVAGPAELLDVEVDRVTGRSGSRTLRGVRSATDMGCARGCGATPGPGRISSSSGDGMRPHARQLPETVRSVPHSACAKIRRGPRGDVWASPHCVSA